MANNIGPSDEEIEKILQQKVELAEILQPLNKMVEYMKLELVTIDSLTGVTPDNFKDKQAQAWAWKKIINTFEGVMREGDRSREELAQGEKRKKELRKKARRDD